MAEFKELLVDFAIEGLYRNAVTSDLRFAAMSTEDFRREFVNYTNPQANIRINQPREGCDAGKLTLEEMSQNGVWDRITNIAPADFYNLIPAGRTVDDFVGLFGQYAMLIFPNAQPAVQAPTY